MAQNQQQAAAIVALDPEAFNDQAARAKSALNPFFVLCLAAYPLVIGFSTAVRSGKMGVVSGRPQALAGSPPPPGAPPSDHDLWKTTDAHSVAMMALSFAAVLITHLVILAYILMKRPAGASEMKKSYAAAAPILMFFITMTYYVNYLGLTRYGASMIEWMFFIGFSAALFIMSIVLFVAPVRQINAMRVAVD